MPRALLLLLLCAIPVAAGIARLLELAMGAPITPDNARFFAAPAPIVLHIVGASAFAVLGALQVAPAVRRRFPTWHRCLGWLLLPCAALAATSGLWLQTFSPRPEPQSPLLSLLRWLFGSGLLICLALGVHAVLHREYARHGAWMLRAYAIALGAGTQSLLLVPWVVLIGLPPPLVEALLMAAGWLINLIVVERFVSSYSPRLTSARRASAIS